MNLDNRKNIANNLVWRFMERVLAQLVAFIVSIVLARLLEPSVFGDVALIIVFTAILQVFVDSGLGNSLIQKKDADDLDFTTVFYTNIVFCGVLYTCLFFLAPIIARFYNNETLVPYIRVLGLTVLISGVKNIQQAYVSRKMLFRKFFFSTLAGTVLAGIIGILLAMNGFGIWALIAQHVINVLVDTIVLWFTVRWRPIWAFSFKRLRNLFSYGWKILVSGLIDVSYNELRQLIIGKYYSSEDLAFYNQGQRIPNLIISNINTSIDSVLFPSMSNHNDDRERVKQMTKRSIKTSVYIMAPLMMGLAFISEPLVRLILKEPWLPCVPYLRICCITFMFYPIHTSNLNAIKAMGRSDSYLRLEIIKKSVGLVVILIMMRISVMAIAYSMLFTSFFGQIVNSWPNRKLIGYGYLEQLRDIFPIILLAVVMGGSVYLLSYLGLPDIITILLQIVLGAGLYILGSVLFRIDSFFYVKDTICSYFKKEC